MLTTSVSLPKASAVLWKVQKKQIMEFAERYLRLKMRQQIRRGVTRQYNTVEGEYTIVTTRWTDAEYDTLHMVAAALRISVSSLIYGLIQLWLKPSRHLNPYQVLTNYSWQEITWDSFSGFIEENLLFHVIPKGDPKIWPNFESIF